MQLLYERKNFNKTFVCFDAQTLHELAVATAKLELYPLLHLTCNALVREFRRKTPKEIREAFLTLNNLPEVCDDNKKLSS